jgi:hypothetical protein
MTTHTTFGTADQLAEYTHEVLAQMIAVIQPYLSGTRPGYAEHIGPHMRHVIEHYETLGRALRLTSSAQALTATVDYDARERDPLVETHPDVAVGRVRRLQQLLGIVGGLDVQVLAQTVQVHLRGGVHGENNFNCTSTVARELMFLNSHTTHHFAVLQGYAKQRGESLGAGLGKAPATVAHELQQLENQHANA